jgi:hypothetical protein
MNSERTLHERGFAIEAMLQLDDPRLKRLADSLETDAARWPNAVARQAMLDLFPTYLPIPRLVKILGRVKEEPRTIGDLNYQLPRKVENVELSPGYLDGLRKALFDMIVDGATWEPDKFPRLRTKRPDLMTAHIAACRRQCIEGIRTKQWIASGLLSIRLSKDGHREREAVMDLRIALAELSPDAREAAFWAEEAGALAPIQRYLAPGIRSFPTWRHPAKHRKRWRVGSKAPL